MLFHSSLRKDLARNFGATLVILITIVMTVILIRTLGQASRGSVNPSEVLLVMGFSVLSQMTTIITLSLFIAVVSTLSRMYSDSEMVIWFSSGQGLANFVRPLLRFAWPVLLIIVLLALFAWPWSNLQIQELQHRYEQRNDLERIAPGQFQESSGGKRVFFIDKDSPDNRFGKNVFVSSIEAGLEIVTTAQQGRIDLVGNERFLKLEKGQQWSTNLATGETRLTQFEHYEVLVDDDVLPANESLSSRHTASWDLLKNPTRENLGELGWRLGLGLAAINLVLLALAVSAINPRVGKSYHLGLALFIFIAYYNMLNVGQSWVATGRVQLLSFLIALHGGVFLLAASWLWARHMNWSWRSFWVRKTDAKGGLK
ncbi:LPS export ABC transporter permease LptF [Limnohabitans sp. MMS-10A-160]|jgi:lipopolysaccharide export system permease protein|uniref:LPS export ABC transporter permease LptF n=1 Tax=unclassified Limnohabitans TaxID=2626134 RepID=UPI000D3678E1|nr:MULTISPECIES: LPS export ABC transporter permease LptF [unclassified Limnohabitans]PUE22103.1 LPS export ABC transporter permease LptF [Limnohabitans sp. MMS-10A-192]PUE25754.1 LPS export ABC transporter permease LptF [Limnohabitans sp. MMS-10A-160]